MNVRLNAWMFEVWQKKIITIIHSKSKVLQPHRNQWKEKKTWYFNNIYSIQMNTYQYKQQYEHTTTNNSNHDKSVQASCKRFVDIVITIINFCRKKKVWIKFNGLIYLWRVFEWQERFRHAYHPNQRSRSFRCQTFVRARFSLFISLPKIVLLSILISISRSIFVRCFYIQMGRSKTLWITQCSDERRFLIFFFSFWKNVQHVTNIVTIYASLFKFTNSIHLLLNEYS